MPKFEELEKQADSIFDLFSWFANNPVHASGIIATILIGILCKVIYDKRHELISQLTLLSIKLFSSFRFNSRYAQQLIYDHRVFNVRGLRTQGTFSLEINKVYVSLKIAPCENPNKTPPLTNIHVLTGNKPIWSFLQQSLRTLAITGAPGCGKTTLLQHIALGFAANQQRAYGLPQYTPIFLFLREHIEKIITDEMTLAELAQAHFSNPKCYTQT